MKVSSAFVLTLLTGALAAPSIISDPDSEKRDVDVAAGEFDGSAIANAVEARQVDTTVILDERDEDLDVAVVARAPGNGGNAKAQGAKKGAARKKGGKKKNKGGKKKNKGAKKNKAAKAQQDDANKTAKDAKPKVTSSFDAPGVIN